MSKHNLENKNNSRKELKIVCIVILLLCIIIFAIIRIVYWDNCNNDNVYLKNILSKYIVETTNKENGNQEFSVDFKTIKEINPDTVAYLKVNNTNINYVVVQGNDNNYYKNHSFDKKDNVTGWIFADYRNKLNFTDYNIVINGYNTRNDNMFGTLQKTLKEEWYSNEENRYITLVTEEAVEKYKIFSIYHENLNDYSVQVDFDNDDEYLKFLHTIKAKSIKNFDVELNATRGIITLSTYSNDNSNRIIVHAISTF